MPTWIVHGFRWPRAQIRIHIILQNLDDAAPEWLMAPATVACLMENFKQQWPDEMKQLPGLRFIEQYDPEDLTVKDQPYAYVCDQVHEIKLGVDFHELRGGGVGEDQWAAIAELRDKVAPGEKLGWFVVVNGDVERWAPPMDDDDGEDTETEATHSQFSPTSQRSSVGGVGGTSAQSQELTSRSIKKWISGRLKKSKSGTDLRAEMPKEPTPPLPPMSPRAALQSPKVNGKSISKPTPS
ncbi:hypothetical protein BDU57DRAFT_474511 [Ampelomyces quisqualis]|uniref:Uncharacterized protein n=1 Tax=Ampelomyces quisqualis TaxID=50730 RepID=A0A6A5QKP0_AMPQU|nr:hypothetical protein BDU57DRAFT_474511 [Ampelomyces quisqualis]